MVKIPRVVIEDFSVGRANDDGSDELEFVSVKVGVRFFQIEVDLDIPCTIFASLYDQSDLVDLFLPVTGMGTGIPGPPINRGEQDHFVGHIQTIHLQPQGRTKVTLSLERKFDFGAQESGNEEYVAVVWAIPDIRYDVDVSPAISVNLG